MPVHFGGLPADMDKISRIARKHKLMVIEDAAHAWGTKWRGKGAGALGHLGGFSFQVSKNITAGEGGITLTDDEELADKARSYSNCGRSKTGAWYEHFLLGGNFRMTEFQGAILRCQLKRLPSQVRRREQNAAILNEQLPGIPGIHVVPNDKRVTQRSYHLYEFRFVPEEFGPITLEQFLQAMRAEGIPCGAGYPHPLYKNPLFLRRGKGPRFCPLSCPYYGKDMDYRKVVCPNAELLCKQAVFMSQALLLGTKKDMQDVVRAVQKVYDNQKAV
jgi:dTDP-4-amino-4,6-dideoxygalactose transaminase